MNANYTVFTAIDRSISHNESVAVTVEAADIYEVLAQIDSSSECLGHSKENDGTYGVFGEDHGGNEFRLRVTVYVTPAVATGGAK
tara:strand:+ start:132 stop:386 length:255 start_codon:yes stop_codon:yes gene_type:complete